MARRPLARWTRSAPSSATTPPSPRRRRGAGRVRAARTGLGALRRLGWSALVGGDPRAWGSAFVALVVTGLVSLVAGVALSAMTGTLESLPGLLLLQPATLAMTGNIYGAFGSRLGTSLHTGTFRLTTRLDSVVGQNTLASLVLGVVVSVATAVAAKGVAVAFDVTPTMSLADFVVVSTVAGTFAGLVLVAIALALAALAARRGWDLD
ncbi:MAG: hypothetical protein D6683_10550, partial [Actinomyces sp.]